MCRSCWYSDHGAPVIAGEEVMIVATWIRRLYVDWRQATGGPLHDVLDDMNIGDACVEPGRDRYAYLYDGTYNRHCQAGDELTTADADQIRDLCELICLAFTDMPEPHRAAAIAWAEGWAQDEAKRQPTWPSPEACELYAQELKEPPRPPRGVCQPQECPPFEDVTLRITAAPWPDQRRLLRHTTTALLLHGQTTIRRDPDGMLSRAPDWQRQAWEYCQNDPTSLHRIAWSYRDRTDPARVEPGGQPRPLWADGWAEVQVDPELAKRLVDYPRLGQESPGFKIDPEEMARIRRSFEEGS